MQKLPKIVLIKNETKHVRNYLKSIIDREPILQDETTHTYLS